MHCFSEHVPPSFNSSEDVVSYLAVPVLDRFFSIIIAFLLLVGALAWMHHLSFNLNLDAISDLAIPVSDRIFLLLEISFC